MNKDDPIITTDDTSDRRSFLVRLAAAVVGGMVVLFPFLVGLGVFLDPLRRRRNAPAGNELPDSAEFVRIGPLAMLPADGVPRQYVVTVDTIDAWSRTPAQRIGSVFLTRTDDNGPRVTALSATCPHLGCAVDYHADAGEFNCPCHEGIFAKDGELLAGPSRRGLDPLTVKLVEHKGQQEVWVAFQHFRPGIAERIPIG